jgi:hypothetical protein
MIPSSMKSSTFPHVSKGMSTSKLLACLKATLAGSRTGPGTLSACRKEVDDGSQSGQCRMSMAKSVQVSENKRNSFGQGVLPNVRRRLGKAHCL